MYSYIKIQEDTSQYAPVTSLFCSEMLWQRTQYLPTRPDRQGMDSDEAYLEPAIQIGQTNAN